MEDTDTVSRGDVETEGTAEVGTMVCLGLWFVYSILATSDIRRKESGQSKTAVQFGLSLKAVRKRWLGLGTGNL